MKTRIAVIAAIAIMTVQLTTAQTPVKKFATDEQKIAFAKKNLLVAIQSTNPGVTESAMRITAQMKMKYPATDVSDLMVVTNRVWKKHPSGCTRYKAYVAMSIYENPEWYSGDKNIMTAYDDTFFYAASARMQEQLLSANTK